MWLAVWLCVCGGGLLGDVYMYMFVRSCGELLSGASGGAASAMSNCMRWALLYCMPWAMV